MSAGPKPVPLPPFLRLVRERGARPGARIREPADSVRLLRRLADAEEVEVFWALLLDSQSQVRGVVEVTRGLVNTSLVHPREVFRVAVIYGAAGVIVAHNHPSGVAVPSTEDRAITRQLVAAGQLLDMPLYDHLILAGKRWYSFAEEGEL